MACPQPLLHTKFSNELLDALYRVHLPSANAFRMVLWVARDSYGWRRHFTRSLSLKDLAKEVNMEKSSVHLALKVLIDAKILTRDELGRLKIQKDYELWGVQSTGRKAKKPSIPLDEKFGGLDEKSGGLDAYKEKERERKGKKTTVAVKPPRKATPIQEIVELYKFLKNIGYREISIEAGKIGVERIEHVHRDWDKANFAIYLRSAKKLLEAFAGDLNAAKVYLTTKASEWDMAGLEGWELHGVARDSVNFAAKEKTKDATNDDRRALPFRPELEGSVGTVDAIGRDRKQGSRRGFTSARELIDEAIERFGPEDE